MKARIYKDQWGIQILCDGAFCYDLDSEEQLIAIYLAVEEYFSMQNKKEKVQHEKNNHNQN